MSTTRPSSPKLSRKSPTTSFSSSSQKKPYNHAAALRTPQEQANMERRVAYLWARLKSCVKSGTAGWLAKYATEAGANEKPQSAASIYEIELPQFSVGDTLPLPSGTIPFVSAARFLRSYLSNNSASSNGNDNNSNSSSGLNGNISKSGHHSPPSIGEGGSSPSKNLIMNDSFSGGGAGADGSSSKEGGGFLSKRQQHNDFAQDRRRTIACKLVLSQHGMGILMSAFWFMILRRFRWGHIHQDYDNQLKGRRSTTTTTRTTARQPDYDGDGEEAEVQQQQQPLCDNDEENLSSVYFTQQQQSHHPHLLSSQPSSPFAKSKRANSALVRSFTRLPTTPNSSIMKSGGTVQQQQQPHHRSASSITTNLSPRGALPPQSSDFFQTAASPEQCIEYAQGLIFNAAFHFGQLYAKYGSEIRTAAILQIFSQMFSATLMNLFSHEFYDSVSEDDLLRQQQIKESRLQQQEAAEKEEEEEGKSGDDDESNDDDENDVDDGKGGGGFKNNNNAGGREKTRILRSQNKKKKEKLLSKDKLTNIFNNKSSAIEMTLEEHVSELCTSWFFGDQATEALQAAFHPNKGRPATPLRILRLQRQRQRELHQEQVNSAAKASALLMTTTTNDASVSPSSLNNNINDNDAAATNLLLLSKVSSTKSQRGFYVPARHNQEAFLKKAKLIDQQQQQQQQQILNNTTTTTTTINNVNNNSMSMTNIFSLNNNNNSVSSFSGNDFSGGGAGAGDLGVSSSISGAVINSIPNNDTTTTITPVPIRLEPRRNYELLQQQRLAEQEKERQQQQIQQSQNENGTTTGIGLGKMKKKNSSSSNENNNGGGVACCYYLPGQNKKDSVLNKRTVTDGMDTLMHTKDGLSTTRKDDTNEKIKARFLDRNSRHLEYCQSRMHVAGVVVDDLHRETSFSVTTRSQLLELGEVMAHFHISSIGGGTRMKKADLMTSQSISEICFSTTLSTSGAGYGGSSGMMTNAFTPRPEASLQLSAKDTARIAGTDSKIKRIRCPFCDPEPHTLRLKISALKMASYVEKQAFKCRCCFASKAGFCPTMECSRCSAALCVDCVQIAQVPVVENVLSKAAMSAATKSYGEVVRQLWGSEISGTKFGPICPSKSVPLRKPTLEDLGVALGTVRDDEGTSMISQVQTKKEQELNIQKRRPLSSVGVISNSSGRKTLVATPCSAIQTPVTDSQVVDNNNHHPTRPASALSYMMMMTNNSTSTSPTPDPKLLSSPSRRQSRLPPLPTMMQKKNKNNNSSYSGGGVSPIPVLKMELEDAQEVEHPNGNDNQNDENFKDDFFNLTATSVLPPRPHHPQQQLRQQQSQTPQPQQQQQQQQQQNYSTSPVPTTTIAKSSNTPTTTHHPRPASAMSCCTWISQNNLQGRVMRTGSRIDAEVFAATDPSEQHAASIGYGWKNRHVVRMTKIPEPDKGNLGRLRSHIQRSLDQARSTVRKAVADSERERIESAIQNRRLREASSRDMIRQFRQEAQQQTNSRLQRSIIGGNGDVSSSAVIHHNNNNNNNTSGISSSSSTVTGNATAAGDEGYHKRQIAAAIERYANKFCGGVAGATPEMLMSAAQAQQEQDEIKEMLARKTRRGEFSTTSPKLFAQQQKEAIAAFRKKKAMLREQERQNNEAEEEANNDDYYFDDDDDYHQHEEEYDDDEEDDEMFNDPNPNNNQQQQQQQQEQQRRRSSVSTSFHHYQSTARQQQQQQQQQQRHIRRKHSTVTTTTTSSSSQNEERQALQNNRVLIAQKMLEDISHHPSLAQLNKASRSKIIDFIAKEQASIRKAQIAAHRLQELLSWSNQQGEALTVEELVKDLDVDPMEISAIMGSSFLVSAVRKSRQQQQQQQQNSPSTNHANDESPLSVDASVKSRRGRGQSVVVLGDDDNDGKNNLQQQGQQQQHTRRGSSLVVVGSRRRGSSVVSHTSEESGYDYQKAEEERIAAKILKSIEIAWRG